LPRCKGQTKTATEVGLYMRLVVGLRWQGDSEQAVEGQGCGHVTDHEFDDGWAQVHDSGR